MKKLFVLLFVVFVVLVSFGCSQTPTQAPATTKITQGDRIGHISIDIVPPAGAYLGATHYVIRQRDDPRRDYNENIDNVSYIEESLYYKQLTIHWKNGKSSSWTQNYSISFK